jgi:hypothetical protein
MSCYPSYFIYSIPKGFEFKDTSPLNDGKYTTSNNWCGSLTITDNTVTESNVFRRSIFSPLTDILVLTDNGGTVKTYNIYNNTLSDSNHSNTFKRCGSTNHYTLTN